MLLNTSFDFDPRIICRATEAELFTFTAILSAKRLLESWNKSFALLLDADAISSSESQVHYYY